MSNTSIRELQVNENKRYCQHCGSKLENDARKDKKYCCSSCRVSALVLRKAFKQKALKRK